MEESNQNFEIKTSRNGLSVPVINGIHLHSIYNPVKEAEAMAQAHTNTIKEKANVLILGLGYGYHVEEIAKIANQAHQDYRIYIIEPNKELAINFNQNRPFEDKNITILNAMTPDKLYQDLEFIKFLMNKPAIIKHDTSFTLEKEFFIKFLKYQAPDKIQALSPLLSEFSQDICSPYLDQNLSFTQTAEKIKNEGIKSSSDFIMLALEAIKNQNLEQSRGA